MHKKTILLIVDDPRTEASLCECLRKEYNLEKAKNGKEAAAYLTKRVADLIIIDFELKGQDGLQVFKDLSPGHRTIMLSSSNNISLAVAATKLGVCEFLRKPINARELKRAISGNLSQERTLLHFGDDASWLMGESSKLAEMLDRVLHAIKLNRDVIFLGGRGIKTQSAAYFMHLNSSERKKRFVKIDLSAFSREALESHFWTMLQDLIYLPESTSIVNEEDRAGSIYLENIEKIDKHFLESLFVFFTKRQKKIDKSIRLMLEVLDAKLLAKLGQNNFMAIEIPRVCQRKADIPRLTNLYLKRYANKYGKDIKYISLNLLSFLSSYDYPGNYLEMESLIAMAVISADSDHLDINCFPLDLSSIMEVCLKNNLRENKSLAQAKQGFDRELYSTLLSKVSGDEKKLAAFLDLPANVLAERFESLLD